VSKFTIAVNRPLSASQKEEMKNEGKATADFPRVVVWGRQAEICCQYLQKGSLIGVVGHVQTSSFENEDGKMIYFTDILADRIQFLNTSRPEAKNERNITKEEEVILS
jgi:single-strand DNA-binding protein